MRRPNLTLLVVKKLWQRTVHFLALRAFKRQSVGECLDFLFFLFEAFSAPSLFFFSFGSLGGKLGFSFGNLSFSFGNLSFSFGNFSFSFGILSGKLGFFLRYRVVSGIGPSANTPPWNLDIFTHMNFWIRPIFAAFLFLRAVTASLKFRPTPARFDPPKVVPSMQ